MMMIKILLLTALITIPVIYHIIRSNQHQQFIQYTQKYHKRYDGHQQTYRRYVYYQNKIKIESHNENKEKNYVMEINQFADLTLLEFKEMYLGLKISKQISKVVHRDQVAQQVNQYEISIDWQEEGRISRVKNQKMCASCWAFSVLGAIQSAYMMIGINQQFSEQQLIDCSSTYGNNGCHGGQLIYTYQYILKKGITTQKLYPYVGKDQNCKKTKGQFHINGYINSITCTGLYNSLIKGPVSVAVDANNWGFYKEGIFDECGNEVNHGVLLIGVSSDYWRIKNSWGAQWGNKGFMTLKRGNTCSICQYHFYPTLR